MSTKYWAMNFSASSRGETPDCWARLIILSSMSVKFWTCFTLYPLNSK